MGSDALTARLDGTVEFSNFLGEMRWYYEGAHAGARFARWPGFVRREFAVMVQGQSFMCGANVDCRRRYLVFSAKTCDITGLAQQLLVYVANFAFCER